MKSSLLAGLLFFIVASPFLFGLVDKLTSKLGLSIVSGECPTYYGLALHAVVFVILTRLLMELSL